MKVSEKRLKEIIKEEVVDRLIDYQAEKFRLALREECVKKGILLTEAQEDDAVRAYKQQSRRDFLKKAGAAAAAVGIPAAVSGIPIGLGQIKGQTDRDKRKAERAAKDAVYRASDQYIIDEISTDLSMPTKFSWTWQTEKGSLQSSDIEDAEGVISQPTDFPYLMDSKRGIIGILAPEYGVMRAVAEDIIDQKGHEVKIPRIEKSDVVRGSGTAAEWMQKFPDIYHLVPDFRFGYYGKGKKNQKGALQRAYNEGFKGDVQVTPQYDGLIYLPFNKIPLNMVMPGTGKSSTEYYLYLWEEYVVKDMAKAKKAIADKALGRK